MSKDPVIPVIDIVEIVRSHVKDEPTIKAVIADINKVQKELAEQREAEKEGAGPKTKNRFVVMIRSDEKDIAEKLAAGAFVLTVPDDDTTDTYNGTALVERIKKAVNYHNEGKGKRGRKKASIKKFTEAMAYLKSKSFKETESKVLIKTKMPVEVIIVDKEDIV